MKLFTIGFAQKSAQVFFELLKDNNVTTLVDARVNNKSQLAGFTKGRDLPYFLQEIAGINYHHEPLLAPTKELLDAYKKEGLTWDEYIKIYNNILKERSIENVLDIDSLDNACLLCSEPTADQCHRRLAAQYLQEKFPQSHINIIHL